MTITLGENIKRYRTKAGMTQEALADAMGITQENISQIENDHVGITVEKLHKLVDALGCTVNDILDQGQR